VTEENLCRQEAMRQIAEPELASALVPHGKHTPYRVEKERVLEPCGYRREPKKKKMHHTSAYVSVSARRSECSSPADTAANVKGKKASYVSVCLREGASA
jgi:hypothetical protein